MKDKSPMELIGFDSIKENFIVFIIFGTLLIILGAMVFDLSKDIPDSFLNIINEPLSIRIFEILSIIGLGIVAVTALIFDENALKHEFITKYALAASRTGLSAGAIVTGMLFGIGAGLWIITLGAKDNNLAKNAYQFIELFVFFVFFITPLILLHLYFLFPWKQKVKGLTAASMIYVGIVIAVLFSVKILPEWKETVFWLTLFIIAAFIIKYEFVRTK